MSIVRYREAEPSDIAAIARIRAAEWGTEEYWTTRIAGYINRELHPQKALMPRVVYVALENDLVAGFVATVRRFYTRHGAERLNEHWMVWNDIGKLLREELRSQ
jgi:hypothetical protein